MPLSLNAQGLTDKGLVRPGNEDALNLDRKNHVYVVCDGMGGHQAGEVASLMAVETIQTAFTDLSRELLEDEQLNYGKTLPAKADLLVRAVRLANRAIYTSALEDSSRAGMGTTVVALAFEADMVAVAHVGDSRAYRVGPTALEPLTRDHSWVTEIQETRQLTREEADSLIGKNIITRALGVRDCVEVDVQLLKTRPGDVFLLCSDGLCGYADDEDIFAAVNPHRNDIKAMTQELVHFANDRGGSDNVTVLAVEVSSIEESPLPELETVTVDAEAQMVLDREDYWLEHIEEKKKTAQEAVVEAEAKRANPVLLIAIFAVFVLAAAAIIYFSQQP